MIQGVEIDYTSNEIQGVLIGEPERQRKLLRALSRADLASYVARSSSSFSRSFVGCCLRRVFQHYRGFAGNQRKELEKPEGRSAKKLLYVLRTALTGAHLLRSRESITDLSLLIDEQGMGEVRALIEAKRRKASSAQRRRCRALVAACDEGVRDPRCARPRRCRSTPSESATSKRG